MAIPAGKTPISYLQEYCTKNNLTPDYQLLSHEGSVHEPTFHMKVTVAENCAEGKGTSKKKAKHSAARAVLAIIMGMQNGQLPETEGGDEGGKEEGGAGNPVGQLQELSQKHMMKPPLYTFIVDQTQPKPKPQDRKFYCTIKLGKLTEKGEGRSKRMSKRAAAAAMMDQINKMAGAGGDHLVNLKSDNDTDDEIPLNMDSVVKKSPAPLLTPQQSQELQLFYENMMKACGKQLKSAGLAAPAANYCQMLQEIADARHFDVALFELEELTTAGHFQAILKMTTNPITVCHGCGSTKDDSRASAAYNALQYLRILTKQ